MDNHLSLLHGMCVTYLLFALVYLMCLSLLLAVQVPPVLSIQHM